MVVFASNGSGTVKPTREGVAALMACDDVTTYAECGWFCAVGWKKSGSGVGSDKVIGLHFGSRDEYLRATGQAPESASDWHHPRGRA